MAALVRRFQAQVRKEVLLRVHGPLHHPNLFFQRSDASVLPVQLGKSSEKCIVRMPRGLGAKAGTLLCRQRFELVHCLLLRWPDGWIAATARASCKRRGQTGLHSFHQPRNSGRACAMPQGPSKTAAASSFALFGQGGHENRRNLGCCQDAAVGRLVVLSESAPSTQYGPTTLDAGVGSSYPSSTLKTE